VCLDGHISHLAEVRLYRHIHVASRARQHLLARDLGMRARLDVDVYRDVARGVAEADLRRAVAADLGDWFRFEVRPGSVIGGSAVRLPVTSLVGVTTWVAFHVDLVGTDLRMTSHPDDVPPLARGVIPEVTQRGYRAYPLVDHVADKIAATYDRYGVARLPSTRYRDLVDLVAIVCAGSVAAQDQRTALQSEFDRRGLVLPDRFEPPDRRAWERGYAAEARRSLLGEEHTLDQALHVVGRFIDPVLAGIARGRWDPRATVCTER